MCTPFLNSFALWVWFTLGVNYTITIPTQVSFFFLWLSNKYLLLTVIEFVKYFLYVYTMWFKWWEHHHISIIPSLHSFINNNVANISIPLVICTQVFSEFGGLCNFLLYHHGIFLLSQKKTKSCCVEMERGFSDNTIGRDRQGIASSAVVADFPKQSEAYKSKIVNFHFQNTNLDFFFTLKLNWLKNMCTLRCT